MIEPGPANCGYLKSKMTSAYNRDFYTGKTVYHDGTGYKQGWTAVSKAVVLYPNGLCYDPTCPRVPVVSHG